MRPIEQWRLLQRGHSKIISWFLTFPLLLAVCESMEVFWRCQKRFFSHALHTSVSRLLRQLSNRIVPPEFFCYGRPGYWKGLLPRKNWFQKHPIRKYHSSYCTACKHLLSIIFRSKNTPTMLFQKFYSHSRGIRAKLLTADKEDAHVDSNRKQ